MRTLLIATMLILTACDSMELTAEPADAHNISACQNFREHPPILHPETLAAYCISEMDAKIDALLKVCEK